MHNM